MAATRTAREPVTCARPGCRNKFTPARAGHVYCSVLCKNRANRYRHALGLGRVR